ncbi:MAG: hypothetical protein ABWY20_23845, partial [Mycobacterium sp.]
MTDGAEQLKRTMLDELVLLAAWRSRRWTADGLAGLGVGFDDERFTLPIRHADGELCHVERYAPPELRNGNTRKMLAPAGAERDLFPAPELYQRAVPIVLCEGAPAAITLHCAGVAASGVPSMATWRSEWAPRFAGRDVIVMPDAEVRAREKFSEIAAMLAEHATSVRIYDVYPERDDGA